MNNVSYSVIESDRFGKSIHRGSCELIDVNFIADYLNHHEPEILIVRFPASEQHNLYKLDQFKRQIIFADTLVYYEWLNLGTNSFKPINDDLRLVEAGGNEIKLLEDLVPAIFQDYFNHYFSNPLLDKKKIVEGYTEWAVNYIDSPGKLNLIVYKYEIPVGFITCSYEVDTAEIILNGVVPNYRKGGVYTDMVRFVKNYFYNRGFKSIKVSTQIQNFAVQNIWVKEGFYLTQAFLTIHLNK